MARAERDFQAAHNELQAAVPLLEMIGIICALGFRQMLSCSSFVEDHQFELPDAFLVGQ
jgi:hypothetical protein